MNEDGYEFGEAGDWLRFDPALPHRGLGWVLVACSSAGPMIAGLIFADRAKNPNQESSVAVEGGFIATAIFLGFLLSGLYFATRRCRVEIGAGVVKCKRGWLFWRRAFEGPTSDYPGLVRGTKEIGSIDLATGLGSLAGMGLAVLLGGGVFFFKRVMAHVVSLKHVNDPSRDLLLICTPFEDAVERMKRRLEKTFDLAMVVPARGGGWAVAAGQAEARVEAAAARRPGYASLGDLPVAPRGIEVTPLDGEMSLSIPNRSPEMKISLAAGVLFILVGVTAWWTTNEDMGLVWQWMIRIAVMMGMVMMAASLIMWSRQWKVVMDRTGITITGWGEMKTPRRFGWESVEGVQVLISPREQRAALLIEMNFRDQWIMAGSPMEWLAWVGHAILLELERNTGERRGIAVEDRG